MVKPLPESCGIAFKEWASVCDALLEGRQTIILRKGGISEGTAPGVFVPEHSEFWLYPTWVHQAEQGVRVSSTPTSSDHQCLDRRLGTDPCVRPGRPSGLYRERGSAARARRASHSDG